MNYQWAVGRISTKIPQGKSIEEHANRGIGYYVLDRSGSDITYGFKFPMTRSLPVHLRLASMSEQETLERRADPFSK